MKGGYKIIDFKNVSLSGTPVTMADVLVDLLNNYEKVVLLSNVVLLGSAKDDCFSTVLSDGAGGVKLNCYDGYISISSSGAVTYTVASASGMAEDISNLQSSVRKLNDMSHVVLKNNSDCASLNAKMVDDQVIPCAMHNNLINTVFGINGYAYGLGIRYSATIFRLFMQTSNYIITGTLNLNTNEWENLTRTALTLYTPTP